MDQADVANGFAYASFFLSLGILADRLHRNELSAEEISIIFARARMIAEGPDFPGDQKALGFARHLLGQSETMVVAAAAQKPPAGPH